MNVARVVGGGLLALGLGTATALVGGYRLNLTDSLPPGVWRVTARPAQRGDVVAVCPPNTRAIAGAVAAGYLRRGVCPGLVAPLLKPIAAVAGDVVELSSRGVAVNGALLPQSAPLTQDRAGRLLPRGPFGRHVLGPGEVWLVSTYNPGSFDSRYLGAFSARAISGAATPVFVDEGPHARR